MTAWARKGFIQRTDVFELTVTSQLNSNTPPALLFLRLVFEFC